MVDRLTLEQTASKTIPTAFRAGGPFAFGPDASIAAVGFSEGAIELWATEPFRKLRSVGQSPLKPVWMTFSEDGHSLAVLRQDSSVEIWDLKGDRLVRRLPPANPRSWAARFMGWNARFAAGGRIFTRIVAGPPGSEQVEIWYLAEDRKRTLPSSHRAELIEYALSADGSKAATSAWDGQIKLWDVATEREIQTLSGQFAGFTALAFTPGGTRLAAGGEDGSITLWDTASLREVARWRAHRYRCHWLSFLDGDRVLLSSGDPRDEQNGHWRTELRVWRAPSLEEID
jgi:WD40 repeat protein